jgi:hypothetical protein
VIFILEKLYRYEQNRAQRESTGGIKVNKSMNEAIVIASEQVEDPVKEMNENNLAMEEV